MENINVISEAPEKLSGRGKETLFRVTYQNQISLIQIADNKASMIIGINSIIISIIVSVTGYGAMSQSLVFTDKAVIIPVVFFILTSLISAVFAIQAAKPKIRRPRSSSKKNKNEKTSLLFFANISQKTMDEYLNEMDKLLHTKNAIYENMTIDIYNTGKVLSRKYKLLGIAYQVFMLGFIVSVLSFLGMLLL